MGKQRHLLPAKLPCLSYLSATRVLYLLAGLLGLFLTVVIPSPTGLSTEAWRTAGLASMMALWWMTGALPLAVTALTPLILAPVLGLGDLPTVAAFYANPILFLFLGGFLIGRAIEQWGLHRRIALHILGLAGDQPGRLLAAIMLVTAFLSLWISNTASAMVMLPIAISLTAGRPEGDRFATAVMLGVAYSATIGGIGSLIGTPPNALFAAYIGQTHGITVGFAQWAMVGLPVSAVLLVVSWLVLSRLTPGAGDARLAPGRLERSGQWTPAERRVAIVAGLTALAWVLRPFAERLVPGFTLDDAWIAMVGGGILFLLPSGTKGRLLAGAALRGVRWDILVLFGGGLALAGLIDRSGLAEWIGGEMGRFHALPEWLLILAFAVAIVYIGELASNTAMAAVFLPVAGAASISLGVEPVSFLLPVALAASVGFMLPVATPPNAIVMDSPAVTRLSMLRAGALLDVVGTGVAVALGLLLAPLLL